MATHEKLTLPTATTESLVDDVHKLEPQSSDSDLSVRAKRGRIVDIFTEDPVSETPKNVENDFPDGGLRAWLVVLGVRIFCTCFITWVLTNIRSVFVMHLLREFMPVEGSRSLLKGRRKSVGYVTSWGVSRQNLHLVEKTQYYYRFSRNTTKQRSSSNIHPQLCMDASFCSTSITHSSHTAPG